MTSSTAFAVRLLLLVLRAPMPYHLLGRFLDWMNGRADAGLIPDTGSTPMATPWNRCLTAVVQGREGRTHQFAESVVARVEREQALITADRNSAAAAQQLVDSQRTLASSRPTTELEQLAEEGSHLAAVQRYQQQIVRADRDLADLASAVHAIDTAVLLRLGRLEQYRVRRVQLYRAALSRRAGRVVELASDTSPEQHLTVR